MAEYENFKISPDATPNPKVENWKVGQPRLNKTEGERIEAVQGKKDMSPTEEAKVKELADEARESIGKSVHNQVNVSPSPETKSSDPMAEARAIGKEVRNSGVMAELEQMEKINLKPQSNLDTSKKNINVVERHTEPDLSKNKEPDNWER